MQIGDSTAEIEEGNAMTQPSSTLSYAALEKQRDELLEICRRVEGVLQRRGEFDWFDIHVRLAVQDAIENVERDR